MKDGRTGSAPAGAPTDVFFVNGGAAAHTDAGLPTVDGRAGRGVGPRTLRKRLARLASSRQMLVLALLLSVSAALTAFRGYLLPVTLFLAAERAVFALGLWRVYFTAGKRGAGFLAAMSFWLPLAAAAGLLFSAAYIFAAMFGKLLLLNTPSAEALARLICKARLWAVLPALLCVAAAYWVYLFARRQRLVLCNLRDGLRYGFAFDGGCGAFARNCVLVAALMLAFQALRPFVGGFRRLGVPAHAAPMFDRLLLSQMNYAVGIAGVAVHAAALVLAALLARNCANTVRKYKAQRQGAGAPEPEAAERKTSEPTASGEENGQTAGNPQK